MKNLYPILLVISLCIFTIAWANRSEPHQHNNANCCEITLEHVDGGVKVIYDSLDDSEDDWIFVEVEYYNEDEDPDVILYTLVDETINMYQEMCYHNHNTYGLQKAMNTIEMIEERALNTDLKECYTWQEIEIIIFGEIQE